MNLRDVPDDVYAALATAASTNRQSLNAYVIDRLTEAVRIERLTDYLASYELPSGQNISLDDTVTAVREVRHAS